MGRRTDERTDGWMDGLVGWMDELGCFGWMSAWAVGRTNRWMDEWMDWLDEWVGGWMDQIDGWMEWMDGLMPGWSMDGINAWMDGWMIILLQFLQFAFVHTFFSHVGHSPIPFIPKGIQ